MLDRCASGPPSAVVLQAPGLGSGGPRTKEPWLSIAGLLLCSAGGCATAPAAAPPHCRVSTPPLPDSDCFPLASGLACPLPQPCPPPRTTFVFFFLVASPAPPLRPSCAACLRRPHACRPLPSAPHPHPYRLIGLAIADDSGVLLMEYCRGGDLYSALHTTAEWECSGSGSHTTVSGGPAGPGGATADVREFGWYRRGRHVALEAAAGLNFLHSRNIVHMWVHGTGRRSTSPACGGGGRRWAGSGPGPGAGPAWGFGHRRGHHQELQRAARVYSRDPHAPAVVLLTAGTSRAQTCC